jgi:hypothetical protein
MLKVLVAVLRQIIGEEEQVDKLHNDALKTAYILNGNKPMPHFMDALLQLEIPISLYLLSQQTSVPTGSIDVT